MGGGRALATKIGLYILTKKGFQFLESFEALEVTSVSYRALEEHSGEASLYACRILILFPRNLLLATVGDRIPG